MCLEEIIFYALCENLSSNYLKTLIEMFSQVSSVENKDGVKNSIKQICLKISKERFEIFSDTTKVVTSFAILTKDFFSEYDYKDSDVLCIGLSMDIFKSCFKYVRKNDSIIISIKKDSYDNFPNIIHFTLNKNKGFSIKFTIIQNIDNSFQNDLKLVTFIPSPQMNNLFKELGGSKKNVKIELTSKQIKLSSTMIDIAENWVILPVETNEFNKEMFIRSEYLKISSKISSFNKRIKMMINDEEDITFSTEISLGCKNLGEIYINIVNKTPVETLQ